MGTAVPRPRLVLVRSLVVGVAAAATQVSRAGADCTVSHPDRGADLVRGSGPRSSGVVVSRLPRRFGRPSATSDAPGLVQTCRRGPNRPASPDANELTDIATSWLRASGWGAAWDRGRFPTGPPPRPRAARFPVPPRFRRVRLGCRVPVVSKLRARSDDLVRRDGGSQQGLRLGPQPAPQKLLLPDGFCSWERQALRTR